MSAEGRKPSAAEFVGFSVAVGQAAASLTMAALVVRDGGGASDTSGSGQATLLVVGVLFGLLGPFIGISAWMALRRSIGARFALIGAEVIFGAAAFVYITIVGPLLTAAAVVVVLLMTVLSPLGRPKPA